jgi:hypothetical protein
MDRGPAFVAWVMLLLGDSHNVSETHSHILPDLCEASLADDVLQDTISDHGTKQILASRGTPSESVSRSTNTKLHAPITRALTRSQAIPNDSKFS